MTSEPAEALAELERRRAEALAMGGPEGIAKHHASGRLTVRERLERLLDTSSWFEVGLLAKPELRRKRPIPGDAVVTGYGRLDGRQVAVIGIDSSIVAGTTAPVSMRKQGRLIDTAQRVGIPIVLLCDADGGRVPDVMGWRFSGLPFNFKTFLEAGADQFTVPRVAAVLGPSYGDSALHASTAHFVVMTESAALALSGPTVVDRAIGESVDHSRLGGPEQATNTGNAHVVVTSEDDAFEALGAFLSYLPAHSGLAAPMGPAREPEVDPAVVGDLVPTEQRRGYDMLSVVRSLVDARSILPWGTGWGPSLLTMLARIDGAPVGVIASQPLVGAGALDPAALRKELSFVDLCDTFNLPIIFLQDVPGLLIGTEAEQGGILRAYESVAARISRATVPKVSVVIRKAYGGGHFALGGRPTHPDFMFAWPGAEMSFMAPETGLSIVHRRALDDAMASGGEAARDRLVAELMQEWVDESAPWESAANMHLDDVIAPEQTREVLIRALEIAWGSRPRIAVPEGMR
ncbi:MAG: acyl-CoA carboxylase subunit beta [Nostocoides sp.]